MSTKNKIPTQPIQATTPIAALNFISKMLQSIFSGGTAIGDPQVLNVDDLTPVGLTIPNGAYYCVVTCAANLNATIPERAIMFSQNGAVTPPTATTGMPIGDNGLVEFTGGDALKNVRFIGIEAGLTHQLFIEYYK